MSSTDPNQPPKFSDPFDRASLFSFQMASIKEQLDGIDKKLDRFAETLNAQDKRMTALERDRFLYLSGVIVAVLFSMLALGAAIYRP